MVQASVCDINLVQDGFDCLSTLKGEKMYLMLSVYRTMLNSTESVGNFFSPVVNNKCWKCSHIYDTRESHIANIYFL